MTREPAVQYRRPLGDRIVDVYWRSLILTFKAVIGAVCALVLVAVIWLFITVLTAP